MIEVEEESYHWTFQIAIATSFKRRFFYKNINIAANILNVKILQCSYMKRFI